MFDSWLRDKKSMLGRWSRDYTMPLWRGPQYFRSVDYLYNFNSESFLFQDAVSELESCAERIVLKYSLWECVRVGVGQWSVEGTTEET